MHGKAIRVLRELRGATQREIARQAHISPSTLSLLESGQTTVSTATLARILESLGYDPQMDSHLQGLIQLTHGDSYD